MSEPGEGVKDTTKIPTEATNLGCWRHTENKPPAKEHTGAGVNRSFTFEADVYLVFMWIF